jgi:hypothetical protein
MSELYGGQEMSGAAKIGKNRPKPTFLTDRGDYSLRKKAKNLERFVDGLFYQLHLYEKTIEILRDACVYGTGILSVYREDDQVHIERVFPWEIIVDIADGRYSNPRNIYLIRWVDKDVLAEKFPDLDQEIHAANVTADDIDHIQDYEVTADRLIVTEAWHLPSGPEADDGRHVCIIEGITLVDEPYNKQHFPFAFLRYKEPVAGFWGNGLGEEMIGWQSEINELGERLATAHYIVGGGIWLVPDGADIVDTELTNGVGVIVHHKPGMPPQYINPDPINQATYQYIKDLPQFAMQFSGISQMSASSEKPAGITAAKALQTLDDVETERFNLVGRRWEAFHMDIVSQCIDLCKEIDEEYGNFTMRAPFKKYAMEINWKDVDMERDAFVMQVFPTALLSKTPSARLQQVQDLFAAGIIDRAMFLRLLDAPDINAEEDLESAARTVADEQIEHMIESDPEDQDAFCYPEPFQDLIYALHRAQANYNLGRIQGMDEPHLKMLRDYMGECNRLLQLQNPPAPPPNMPPANSGMAGMVSPDQLGPMPMQGMPTAPPMVPGVPVPPGPPGMPPGGMPPQGMPPVQ